MFKVMLLNDDYTPDGIRRRRPAEVLRQRPGNATQVMLKVHREGIGVCGVYLRDAFHHQSPASRGILPKAPASVAVRDGRNVTAGSESDTRNTRNGKEMIAQELKSQSAHGVRRGPPETPRVHYRRAPVARVLLLDNLTAAEVLRACGANMDESART